MIVFIAISTTCLFVLSGLVFTIGSEPPIPEITYGEFPISVIYEINGEIRTLENVIVCKFDGVESRGSAGKYRKWKSYLKNEDNNFGFFTVGKDDIELEVGIFIGSPNYYMGDFEQDKEEYERVMNDDRFREYVEWKDGVKTGNSFSKDEVWDLYKFKIIDVKYSKPIKNSFR